MRGGVAIAAQESCCPRKAVCNCRGVINLEKCSGKVVWTARKIREKKAMARHELIALVFAATFLLQLGGEPELEQLREKERKSFQEMLSTYLANYSSLLSIKI